MRIAPLLLALVACSRSAPPDERAAPAVPVVVATDAPGAIVDPPALLEMMRDRPAFRTELVARPAVHAWVAARFRGEGNVEVAWDAAPPQSGQPAEHVQPHAPGDPAILRIDRSASGVDQIAMAMFELINMQRGADFAALWGQAVAHRLARDPFAEGMTKLEHRAAVQTAALAHSLALVAGDADPMLRSLLTAPTDYAAFRIWVTGLRGYDPETYWRTAYDSIAPATP